MAEQTAEQISDVAFALLRRKFLEWIVGTGKKQLNILITGKSGVGKSRLVNALVGTDVAKEGRKKDSFTNEVASYGVVIAGIHVLVWDSPGLQDGTCDEELYLANLKATDSKHGFDIVIYCLKMDDNRFYSEDKRAISKLTEGFGKDLWKKVVIALTFANKMKDPDGGDELAFFKDGLTEWETAIHGILTKLGIDSKVLDTLPIVPSGNFKEGRSLPTRDDWLSGLWISCYSVLMPNDSAAGVAWYLINQNRMTFSGSNALAVAISSVSNYSQRACPTSPISIELDEEQEGTFWKWMWKAFKPVVATMGLTVVGVGVTILKQLLTGK